VPSGANYRAASGVVQEIDGVTPTIARAREGRGVRSPARSPDAPSVERCGGPWTSATDPGTLPVAVAPPGPVRYSAVVGSIMLRTSETRFAGNPPIWACFRTVASSGAM
jgi:hypothetical protein